jgi:plastocyanin
MRAWLALPLLAMTSPAYAGELIVIVKTESGAPVRDAVVTLYPAGKQAPLGTAARNYRIVQRDIRFNPFVLVVPVGSHVSFPNLDSIRHHVYSFSPVKKFELKLYAKEQSRSVHFDKAGAVPIGCNIHDQMAAFVKVVDTGLRAQSDGSGRAVIADVPQGPMIARIWHPYLRAPANQLELRWTGTPARQVQQVKVKLRPPPPARTGY